MTMMTQMTKMKRRMATLLMGGAVLASLSGLSFAADAKQQTLTGQVGDAMCGHSHMMPGKNEAECTRACIKEGSNYALIVGDKVYVLKGKTDGLDAFAGKTATVTGTLKGQTMTVSTVAEAK